MRIKIRVIELEGSKSFMKCSSNLPMLSNKAMLQAIYKHEILVAECS